jgi:hypothetical protein
VVVVVEALMHFIDVAAVGVEGLAIKEDGGDVVVFVVVVRGWRWRHIFFYVVVGEWGRWVR